MRRRDCAAGLLSLGLAGLAGAGARAADARTIKIATIGMANSPWDMALRRFKQVAEAEGQSRYAVSVYTDGSLGDIAQLLSAMQLGTVEFSAFGLTSITLVRGGEPLNVSYTPYLFGSAAGAERVLNNDEFRAIYEKIGQSAGVRVFGAWGQRSPRALQTVPGPITTPDQVKGLRLRIPAIPMLKAVFERLGAQITPLGMLEIYNALSRGTIDGQDNGFDLSIPAHYQDVAKNWSATNHAFELVGFFASERFWRSLPPEHRSLFEHASKEAGAVVTDLTRKLDEDSIGILKTGGCTYTVPDREAFKPALAGVERSSTASYGPRAWPTASASRRTAFDPPARVAGRTLAGLMRAGVVAAMLLVLLSTIGQVADRHLIKSNFGAYDQYRRLGLVWLTFLGFAIAVRDRANIRVDLLDHFIPARAARMKGVVLDLAMAGVAVLLLVVGWPLLDVGSFQVIMDTPFDYEEV